MMSAGGWNGLPVRLEIERKVTVIPARRHTAGAGTSFAHSAADKLGVRMRTWW